VNEGTDKNWVLANFEPQLTVQIRELEGDSQTVVDTVTGDRLNLLIKYDRREVYNAIMYLDTMAESLRYYAKNQFKD